jgi:hypothetical protein
MSQAFMGLPGLAFRAQDFLISFSTLALLVIVFLISKKTFNFFDEYVGKREFVSQSGKTDQNQSPKTGANGTFLILIALNLMLAPGFMMSLQPSWWDRADLAHSYLGVMITEFGTALLLSFLLLNSPFLTVYSQIYPFKKRKRKK